MPTAELLFRNGDAAATKQASTAVRHYQSSIAANRRQRNSSNIDPELYSRGKIKTTTISELPVQKAALSTTVHRTQALRSQ